MGGSGGGFDPDRVRSDVRQLERSIEDAAYEADVASFLNEVLAAANDRDVEKIKTHLTSIQQAVEKETDGFVELLFGGSVSKRTYVAGISDVDALLVLNDSALSKKTPAAVVDYLVKRLRERLPGVDVVPDGFAVSVKYADGVVQIVPVKRRGEEFLLPSDDCKTWSRIRPRAFTDALTAVNKQNNSKVIPTVKLAKVALTEMPEQRRPSGYHLEALAVEIFSAYRGTAAPKDMLTHFFKHAAERVLQPIADRTGQSAYVDADLGAANSLERQILSDSLGRIARRLQNADGAHSVEQWRKVFDLP
jgi:hypothetical protein